MANVAIQRPNDPLLKMDYLIEIEGISDVGFKEWTDIKSSFQEATYREGNQANHVTKQNGIEEFDNVTFSRGIFKDIAVLSDWYATGERKTIDVVRLKHDRDGDRRAAVYRLYEARPISLSFGSGDATAGDENTIQELEISYEYGERVS